jgi:hypothetical protein
MATKEYDALIDMGVRSLPAKTLWCIIDPGGEPMLDTASKRFDEPVIMFCSALNAIGMMRQRLATGSGRPQCHKCMQRTGDAPY